MVDLSDDELLAELGVSVEQKTARTYTAQQERVIAGFEDILKFYDEHGRVLCAPVLIGFAASVHGAPARTRADARRAARHF